MTECSIHSSLDRLSGTLSIRTLRCAHYGERYIHERVNDEHGWRWFNLIWEPHPVRMPLLIQIKPSGDEVMWDILITTMKDNHA